LVLFSLFSIAANTETVYNPFTGKLDYIVDGNFSSGLKINATNCEGSGQVLTTDIAGNILCVADQTSAGGNIKKGGLPYLYNDTDAIYWNDTYGNITYLRIVDAETNWTRIINDNTTQETAISGLVTSNSTKTIQQLINNTNLNVTDIEIHNATIGDSISISNVIYAVLNSVKQSLNSYVETIRAELTANGTRMEMIASSVTNNETRMEMIASSVTNNETQRIADNTTQANALALKFDAYTDFYDQSLNKSDNPTFNNLTLDGNITIDKSILIHYNGSCMITIVGGTETDIVCP